MRMMLVAIGTVESPLTDLAAAPKQGDEGAPEAWLVFDLALPRAATACGRRRADRADVARSGPARRPERAPARRRDPPAQGVFATRSPDRPNPIGLHRVRVIAIDGTRVRVRDLEALDGTPIVDLKPVLAGIGER